MTWHMRTMGGVSVRQTGGIGMHGRGLDCVGGFLFFLDGSTVTRSDGAA